MERRVRPVRRSDRFAWLIIGPLILYTVALTVPVATRNPTDVWAWSLFDWSMAAGLLVLLLMAVRFQLRLTVHRQLTLITLSELPLLIALVYLPPLAVLVIRVVAAMIDLAFRRPGLVKSIFNVSALAAGVACANAVIASYGTSLDLVNPRSWLVLAAAVFAYSFTTFAAISALTALLQGTKYLPQLFRAMIPNQMVNAIIVLIGLVMLLALAKTNWAVVLLPGLAAAMGLVYRSYAQFARQHQSLVEIHELTKATANVPGGRIADVLLERLRGLVQTESATLWLPARGRHPEVLLTATVDYRGLLDRPKTPDSIRRRAFDTGQPVTVGAKLNLDESTADLRQKLRQLGTKDAIVVPLRSGEVVIGTLEVAGRLGAQAFLSTDDVRVV